MVNFIPFSDEAKRLAANLAQRHDAFIEVLRREDALPSSMFFAKKASGDYLVIKRHSKDNGTTIGARNSETEAKLASYLEERSAVATARSLTEAALLEIIRQYKALKLPRAMPKASRILRELDVAGLLGTDLMLVGTNAFVAYQIEAGCRFEGFADETEDFDLAWCRQSGVSLIASSTALSTTSRQTAAPPSLLSVLKKIDRQYRINRAKPCQAIDSEGYEVELLVAPSIYATLSKDEHFSPMPSLIEQEWLLRGTPVRHVVISRDDKTCPLYVPDPRWMALHKLWLADKPERNANKRDKDRVQGNILLDAIRGYMTISYPLDLDFVLDLPEELIAHFSRWAEQNKFVPGKVVAASLR
jgi:hypothetical protein